MISDTTYPFRLPRLPYSYSALEPYIDRRTMFFHHDLYFDLLTPAGQKFPPELAEAFGGEDNWRQQMKAAALGLFGSGFVWLVRDESGALKILPLPNQDNPLSDGMQPILPLDVWEHAYYLKHQNLRSDYIDSWFQVIHWDGVRQRLQETAKSLTTFSISQGTKFPAIQKERQERDNMGTRFLFPAALRKRYLRASSLVISSQVISFSAINTITW